MHTHNIHTHAHTHRHTLTQTHIFTCKHTLTHTQAHAHTHTHTHILTHLLTNTRKPEVNLRIHLSLTVRLSLSLAWIWLCRQGWLIREPQESICFHHPSPGLGHCQHVPPCLAFLLRFWNSNSRQCLHGKHFTDWHIYLEVFNLLINHGSLT